LLLKHLENSIVTLTQTLEICEDNKSFKKPEEDVLLTDIGKPNNKYFRASDLPLCFTSDLQASTKTHGKKTGQLW
jgi:hypothetical protein